MLFRGPCLLLCGPYYVVLLYCMIVYKIHENVNLLYKVYAV